jgi:hypothetical protein
MAPTASVVVAVVGASPEGQGPLVRLLTTAVRMMAKMMGPMTRTAKVKLKAAQMMR